MSEMETDSNAIKRFCAASGSNWANEMVKALAAERDDSLQKITYWRAIYNDVCAERDALLAANESLAKDAERYRHIRQHTVQWNALAPSGWHTGNGLDAAIDAALAASASAKESEK